MNLLYKRAFLSLVLSLSVSNMSYADIETDLLNNISKAQTTLQSTQSQIARERAAMMRELNSLEVEVLSLREKTAVARRLSDEKTLGLSQLEDRVSEWKQQEVYQANLLSRYLRQQNAIDISHFDLTNISEQLLAINEVIVELERDFFPAWQERQLITEKGSIVEMPTLAIGPVTWYWDNEQSRIGLASEDEAGLRSTLRSTVVFGDSESAQVSELMTTGQGYLSFDPTQGRAVTLQQSSESISSHVAKGGLWAIPILLFAVFALSIAIYKAIQLYRLPKLMRLTPALIQSLLNQTPTKISVKNTSGSKARDEIYSKLKGMQKDLLTIAQGNSNVRTRDDLLFVQLQSQKQWLDKWIGAIAITAAVSPLLGLLGTVSGMIETFKMMTLFGSGDPEVVSGGIAQALVTTELGLIVAIPALVLNALLNRKAKSYYSELESFAISLSPADQADSNSPKNDFFDERKSSNQTQSITAKDNDDTDLMGVPA